MAISYARYERRDGADRDKLGRAALAFCRAVRTDTTRARFYWASADTVVILTEAPEVSDFHQAGTPEGAAAVFALADLAVRTAYEDWIDAGRGEQTYQMAHAAAGARR